MAVIRTFGSRWNAGCANGNIRRRFPGGSPIGIFELTCDPVKESTREMPDEDYEKEGFLYLHQHSKLIPTSSPFSFSMTDFNDWRKDDETLWVIRFCPILIFSEALDRLEKLKRDYGY